MHRHAGLGALKVSEHPHGDSVLLAQRDQAVPLGGKEWTCRVSPLAGRAVEGDCYLRMARCPPGAHSLKYGRVGCVCASAVEPGVQVVEAVQALQERGGRWRRWRQCTVGCL